MYNRVVNINKTYKHFKGNFYKVVAISHPNLKAFDDLRDLQLIKINDTRHDNSTFYITKNGLAYYHHPLISEDLMVIYKRVDTPNIIWGREYNEFLSEVDKEKYPNVTQKYRFEEVLENGNTNN